MDILAGKNPIIEALRAGRSIKKIIIKRNIKQHGTIKELINIANIKNIPIETADVKYLNMLASGTSNQGVIALAESKQYINLEDLLSISKEKNEVPLYLILDGIEDPHNLGAILRTAEATGIHGVILRKQRAVGITPTVIKSSAGAIEYVPIVRVNNISQSINMLKKKNIWIVGIDSKGSVNYDRVDYRLPIVIVIGSEGMGISSLVRKHCDWLAAIPMKGKISSLNASVAASIVMYEALRQRYKI